VGLFSRVGRLNAPGRNASGNPPTLFAVRIQEGYHGFVASVVAICAQPTWRFQDPLPCMDSPVPRRKTFPVSSAEVIGGLPLISVIGTPRTMGEHLGGRLKPRLQVLAQYLYEQLAGAAQVEGQTMAPDDLRRRLRESVLPAAQHEPALWMEIESMARASGLPEEDLLLIHGYGDLLSSYNFPLPPARSTYIGLGSPHTDNGLPRLVLVAHLDPALLPYMTLLKRIPAHGPVSLSLTLAGLAPMAGMSEAGLAVATNELRVRDGVPGQFNAHLLASTLTAPSLDDAVQRVQQGPRQGGMAVHLMTNGGDRVSLELSGKQVMRLDDPFPASPRVHTNHVLNPRFSAVSTNLDQTSRPRLAKAAAYAVAASGASPSTIAGWFGLERTTQGSGRQPADGMGTEATVIFIADPATKTLHVRRSGTPAKLESVRL